MRNIWTLIRNAFSILRDAYSVIRAQFPGFVLWGLFLPILLSILFAWFGWNIVNIIFSILIPFVGAYIFSHPGVIGGIIAVGAGSSPRHPIDNTYNLTTMVARAIGHYVFFLSIWFFIIGTWGIGRNHGNTIVILAVLMILYMISLAWAITATWMHKLIFTYACAVLVINVAGLIPATTYNKVIGVDPFAYFRTSLVDKQLVKVEETAANTTDKHHRWLLNHVERKISGLPDNTDVNEVNKRQIDLRIKMATVEQIKEERNRNSLLGLYKRVRNSFRSPNGIEGAEDNPEIRIIKHSDKVWEIEFLTDQMTTVLRRWPTGATIVFAGYKNGEVTRNDPAGGDVPFYLPVGIPLGRTVDTSLIAKYKMGGKILLNFS